MADPEGATRGGVQRGPIGAAVIGQDPLHRDAVAVMERDGASEKPDDETR
jgi:hypothetical protein